MKEDNSEFFEEFLEDMTELLENMSNNLNKLKKDDKSDFENIVNEIFRYAHSLKGMAAAMEFSKMEKLTHKMEDVLYEIREGKLEYTKDILNLFCKGYQYLSKILENIEVSGGEDEESLTGIEELTEELGFYIKKDEIKIEEIKESLKIDEENYKIINEKIKNGKKMYFFKIFINQNSSFKMVRAYMAMECLKKHAIIYSTCPEEKRINNGEGDIYDDIIYGILETDNIDIIVENIIKISEIDDFETEIIKKLEKEYKVVNHKKNTDIDIEEKEYVKNEIENSINYSEDVEKECKEKIEEIIDIIEDIDEDAEMNSLIRQIIENIEFINELFQVHTTESRDEILEKIKKVLTNIEKTGYKYYVDKISILMEYVNLLNKIIKNKEYEKSNEFKNDFNKINERETNVLEKNKLNISDNDLNIKKSKKNINNTNEMHENIRIPASKADMLVDMLEELIVAQSQLKQEALEKFSQDSSYVKNLLKMFRITKEVQDLSISFRMITLKTIFQKVKITVRDTAKKLEKKIDLEIIGEDTEIDRLVANKLLDPLLHLVKNSISHGIETKEKRIKSEKSEKGNVIIVAYSIKGHVYIEVSDDGQGIDTAKVYKKAKEKGLIDEKKTYTQEEIVELIMLPGFSTSESIDTISGRGVGMDVVKTEISKLSGKISIENYPGLGCKFTIKVPKNMTAMNGTVVDIAGQNYIIPTNYIKEIFKAEDDKWITVKGVRKKVKLRNNIINLINMKEYFDIKEDDDYEKIVVILEVDKTLKALVVTDILERREVVVKSIGDDFANVKHIFGAAILGDGNASLILDIENMFN